MREKEEKKDAKRREEIEERGENVKSWKGRRKDENNEDDE